MTTFTILDYSYEERGEVVATGCSKLFVIEFVNELFHDSPDWHFLYDPSVFVDVVDILMDMNFEVITDDVAKKGGYIR